MEYKIYLLPIFTFILLENYAIADEAFAFCADNEKNWGWLIHNDDYVKVKGVWREMQTNNSTYFYYFIPNEGMDKIIEIQKDCVESFGNDFIYPQAGSKKSNDWFVFAASSYKIIDGYVTEFSKFSPVFYASKG
ncbi:hypothetical protein [Silvanigrella aquatica]|uniref:Uncharacterized protein n=1 Tax=Silvanigrella aquatica TaxID=1915309 RepID=A0A1L4D0E8_9BACT|nr:hypothetical protein [Silvanigrella aquatica]APJ03669.1 hypothetical protein AXG55_07010 [Silvanigrella aquatica]